MALKEKDAKVLGLKLLLENAQKEQEAAEAMNAETRSAKAAAQAKVDELTAYAAALTTDLVSARAETEEAKADAQTKVDELTAQVVSLTAQLETAKADLEAMKIKAEPALKKARTKVEVALASIEAEIRAKKPEIPQNPVYTWYPSNTVSTMGLSFRNVRPDLTKKWYHFTPVDLSQQGEQVIPLVASNMFFVGWACVNVTGDEVTVTYKAHGQNNTDTFRVHSEFLTFFPDLDSVTGVEPENLGEGFKFGKPISIEKDLGGDTNVLLFAHIVATYCDYYTKDLKYVRYSPNLIQYQDYRDALQGLMD